MYNCICNSADIKNAYELSEEHILEFLSYWLVQQYVLRDESKIQYVFRNMAKTVARVKPRTVFAATKMPRISS